MRIKWPKNPLVAPFDRLTSKRVLNGNQGNCAAGQQYRQPPGLYPDYPVAGEAACGQGDAGIDDQRAMLRQQRILDRIVVAADQRDIRLRQQRPVESYRPASPKAGMLAGRRDLGQERVTCFFIASRFSTLWWANTYLLPRYARPRFLGWCHVGAHAAAAATDPTAIPIEGLVPFRQGHFEP